MEGKEGDGDISISFVNINLKKVSYMEMRYVLLFALYGHSLSIGHSRHRVAEPAAGGFSDFLKC